MSKITIYSTPGCPYCRMLKEFLRNKGVEFEDKDVSKDIEAAKEMVEKTGHMGVPQMEINEKVIVGFNREEIEKELKKLNT